MLTTTAQELYGGISSASGTDGGVRFKEGNHRVRILKVEDKESSKDNARLFIVSSEIIRSDVMRPGEQPGYVLKKGPFPKLFFGDMADFMRVGLSALFYYDGRAIDPDDLKEGGAWAAEFTPEVAYEITHEENILVGIELNAYAYKRDGSDFVKVKWSVPDDVKAKAKK